MTVRRVDISSLDHRKRKVRGLGKMVVTIDDLAGLMTMIKSLSELDIGPVVHFSGGNFDDPEDLRTLSDDELRNLTIRTDIVTVELGYKKAQAEGVNEAVDVIERSWARPRQARVKVRRYPFYSIWAGICFALSALLAAFTILVISVNGREGVISGLMLAILPIGLAGWAWSLLAVSKIHAHTLIVPMKLDEYRTEQKLHARYRLSTTVAVSSIISGGIGVALTLLFK